MHTNAVHRAALWCGSRAATAACMKKTAAVNLRLTEELRDKIKRLADADGRELSGYIRRVLELHVQAEEERAAKRAAPPKRRD